jgi:hypothetical protein
MLYLVNTMSTHQWEELNVVEGSACNCSCPTWKPSSHAMATKVLQIASWVLMRSLPWTQHKRWISIRLIACVHTHWGMPTIEGWGSPSHIWSVVEKIGEDNRKVRKIGQTINQAPAPRLEHDKIQARWASNVLLKNMLERVWWCKCSEIESWNWTICCLMNCSNGGTHTWARGGRRLHWGIAGKEMCCCLTSY